MQRKSTQSGHKPNAPPTKDPHTVVTPAYEKLVNLGNLETLRPFCVSVRLRLRLRVRLRCV